MRENVADHDHVEGTGVQAGAHGIPAGHLGIVKPGLTNQLAGSRDGGSVLVDPDHPARRADQPGELDENRARAAPEVDDASAGHDTAARPRGALVG